MNRLMLSSLFAVLLLVMAACGGGNSSSSGGSSTPSNDSGSSEAPAVTYDPVDLTISHFMGPTHTQNTEVLEKFAAEVAEVTEGRVTGTLYPANALGESAAQYDLTVSGVADMSMALHGYTPGRFPLTSVTELPFMGTDSVHGTEILWGLQEKFPGIAEEHEGTMIAWIFKNDPAQIMTVDKKISTPEDLRGLRIRTPSPAANGILEAYGAIPVSMPMGDVYEAMQRGVVDGALAPASVITNFKLGDVTNYITRGSFYTSSIFVVMNPDTWNKISPEDQEKIQELFEKYGKIAAEQYVLDENKGWAAAEEAGIEIFEITADELEKWTTPIEHLNDAWVEEMNGKGLPGTEVLEEALRLRD